MTSFPRSGHYRTNSHGTTFWVREHAVDRDNWGPGQPSIDLRRNDASRLLERCSVRTISGCFVNPNAHCPVCGTAVYFYANEFGSRVYFDGLGPPWPKHPCTDNQRHQNYSHEDFYSAPTARTRGITQELLTAANIAGISRGKVAGARAPGEWTLLTVTSVERHGEKNTLKAEFLDSLSHEVTAINCFSPVPILEVGDFIGKRGNEVSFLYKAALTPIVFVVGGVVSLPQREEFSANSVSSARAQATKKRSEPPRPMKTRGGPKQEITEAEMTHFQSGSVSIEQFCAKLAPLVRALAREGTRKPGEVALRLNFERRKTARGDEWTPRLVHLLLGFIFNDKRTVRQPGDSNKKREDYSRSNTTAGKQHGTERPQNRHLFALRRLPVSRLPRKNWRSAERCSGVRRVLQSPNEQNELPHR